VEKKLKNKIIQVLRKASYSHPARSLAKKKARVAPSTYLCNICKTWIYDGKKDFSKLKFEYKNVKTGKIHIDHIDPVIPLTGWMNFDNFITRLFCSEDNLQILCSECHKEKTFQEKEQRKQIKGVLK
jgi:5-methylcytosine-specific restriction endonuclease McrA